MELHYIDFCDELIRVKKKKKEAKSSCNDPKVKKVIRKIIVTTHS